MKLLLSFVFIFLLESFYMDKRSNHTDKNLNENSFAEKREQMVNQQIRSRGVHDARVINAMMRVPRHEFVPAEFKKYAYDDNPLLIGYEQTISQPYIVAFMTESLELRGQERVLEIGTGSGYQTAVLAELAAEVFSIEIVEPLYHQSVEILGKLGYENIQFRCGDGYDGWPEAAPFDAIIVTAAPPSVPEPLLDQLGVDGRMIIPLGETLQKLVLITKDKQGELHYKELLPVRFVPMTGKADD